MLLGDAVNVGAQAQRQLRHVERCSTARGFLQIQKILLCLQNALHQIRRRGILQIEKPGLPGKHSRKVFHRKTIVPGRHWSVGREDAFTADLFDVLATDGFPSRLGSFFVEQLQRKQRGVAFVHVVAREVVVAQRVENAHASDS